MKRLAGFSHLVSLPGPDVVPFPFLSSQTMISFTAEDRIFQKFRSQFRGTCVSFVVTLQSSGREQGLI